MYEKVNPSHPDKIADRIAGAVVDLAYRYIPDPKIAVEVLIGHRKCFIIAETDTGIEPQLVFNAVKRILGQSIPTDFLQVPQDKHLSDNQKGEIRCGDNGIFKGTPITEEQKALSELAHDIYSIYPYDGKYLVHNGEYTVCQSHANTEDLKKLVPDNSFINPLGDWTGGIDVDAGATNRKLGSDMGDGVTGGGLHGKDLSKADVSVNIYAFLKAQETGKTVELSCSIGDDTIDGKPYSDIVEIARKYIQSVGGFEKFAEWGLV